MARKPRFQWLPGEKYPRLLPDSPDASRITNASVAEYIRLEDTGPPDAYSEADVRFIRSAACDGFNVWLWSCKAEKGDIYVDAYADARRFGPTCLGTSWQLVDTMTAEEYLKCLGYWPTRKKEVAPQLRTVR
jgi:hypothetical protein